MAGRLGGPKIYVRKDCTLFTQNTMWKLMGATGVHYNTIQRAITHGKPVGEGFIAGFMEAFGHLIRFEDIFVVRNPVPDGAKIAVTADGRMITPKGVTMSAPDEVDPVQPAPLPHQAQTYQQGGDELPYTEGVFGEPGCYTFSSKSGEWMARYYDDGEVDIRYGLRAADELQPLLEHYGLLPDGVPSNGRLPRKKES